MSGRLPGIKGNACVILFYELKYSARLVGPRHVNTGGVGWFIINQRVRARIRYCHRHLSVVTVELSIPGKRTLSIVGAYLPHANSTHVNVLEDSVTAIEAELGEEKRRGHTPLFMADTNTRLGNSDGHFTCDQVESPAARVHLIRGMLNRVGISELHGRERDHPASCTNWAVGSTPQGVRKQRLEGKAPGSEVDMIAWGKDMREGPNYMLHRVPQLDDDERQRNGLPQLTGAPMHAPLTVTVKLRSAVNPAAPPGPQQERSPPLPAYEDTTWFTAAEAANPSINAALEAVKELKLNGKLDTDANAVHAAYTMHIGAIADAVKAECFGHRRDALPGEADPRRQPAHCDSRDGIRRYHRNGQRASPQLLEARHALNRQAKLCKRIQAARAATQAAPRESNERLAAEDAEWKQLKKLSKAKSRAAKQSLKHAIAAKSARDELLLRTDAHSAAQNLKRENDELPFACQGKPHIPSAASGPPAIELFPAFISELIGGPKPGQPQVPAVEAALAAAAAGAPIPNAMRAVPDAARLEHATGPGIQMNHRAVTAEDVYVVLFPATKKVPYDCINGHIKIGEVSACKTCARFNQQLTNWNEEDPRDERPEFGCKLRTSKSPGPDGITAEFLSWLRPQDRKRRHPFRMKICEMLALFFTGFLTLGKVPPSFKEGLSIALLKPSKTGVQPDRCAPDNYRFITMCNTLAKLFGTVLLVRCSHWGDLSGTISGSQNAFRSGRNCEQHVISLTELIRARKRGGSTTWVLFVDFRKAYDTVNHAALWAVARRAGVTKEIVNILADWNTNRTAKLSINSELSAPYTIGIGVPQGDVLSPWLFNLFIESLVRTLKADITFTGVNAFGINVKELLYADDLALLCNDRAQVQRALDIVSAWCSDWGMQISTGKKKTEVLVFPPDQPSGALVGFPESTEPFSTGTLAVEVTAEYRYLGHEMNAKLEFEPIIERYAAKMWDNYNRFFRTNSVARNMSLRAQIIQLRTFVLSCTNYLASALPADAAAKTQAMDLKVGDMLHNLLALPGPRMSSAIWQEAAVQPTITTWVRERTRVFLEVYNHATFDDSIVLHRILIQQQYNAYFHADTWLTHTLEMLRANDITLPAGHISTASNYAWAVASLPSQAPSLHLRLGYPTVQPLAIKRIAAVFAREVGMKQWLTLSQKKLGPWLASNWACRPPTRPSLFRAWLPGGHGHNGRIRSHASWHKTCTPLSVTAPGGSGCIIANAKVPMAASEPVRAARQGSFSHLIAKPRAKGGNATAECKVLKKCEACQADFADPYHFLIECTEARCLAARVTNYALTRGIAEAVARHAVGIADRLAESGIADFLRPHADAVDLALPEAGDNSLWMSATGKAVMARLAFAQPWAFADLPESIATSALPEDVLATALGRLFDEINWPRFLTQPLSTEWTSRASKIHRLCNRARDCTHSDPDHQVLRRGGQRARENKAAANAAAAEAGAAAAAAAAAGSGPLLPYHSLRPAGSVRPPQRYGAFASDEPEPDLDSDGAPEELSELSGVDGESDPDFHPD